MRGARLLSRPAWRLACALLAVMPAAHALDPQVALQDYHHDTWRRKDGAPGSITSIAQSGDGWLWVGTDHGLYRFDGLSFQRFQSPSGQRLLSARISTLTGRANGDLLVGYLDGGVNLIRRGDIVPLPAWSAARIDMVYDIVADGDDIWLCTRAGLVRYARGAWQHIGSAWGLPRGAVEEGTLDQYGQLWVLSGGAWYQLDRAARRFQPTGRSGEEGAFFAPDGAMWRRKGRLLVRVPNTPGGQMLPRAEPQRHLFRQTHHLFDADGNLWVLRSPSGILRIRRQDLPRGDSFDPAQLPAERMDQPWQLSNTLVTGLLEDREGNLWAMTPSGLERFRNQRIRTVPLPDGAEVATVAADGQGRIWAAAAHVAGLWQPAHDQPPTLAGARQIVTAGRDGAVLTAGARGIERRRDGHTELLALPPACAHAAAEEVNRLAEDRTSTWVALRSCGLFRYEAGRWRSGAELGIPAGERYIAPAPDGATWFGYRNGEVLRYHQGRLQRPPLADGGTLGAVRFIDTQQEVVISGGEGTAVLRNGVFQRLRSAEAEALNNLAGLVITPNGDRWLNTGLGLAHVRQADWRASVSNPQLPLRMALLDAADGYPGQPVLFATVANGAIDDGGRIWWAGTEGLGVLDTRRLYRNPLPPTLQVNSISIGARSYPAQDLAQPLRLPQRPARLDIAFAALSLTMPEKMQVLYKLDGVDRDWQAAGQRRMASYSNLGPGQYRFTVKAANADGVWNEAGASVTFEVEPGFTQTVWFYLLCLGLAGAAVYGAYLLRLRRVVRRMNAVLAARLLERERIARALHDSLLQSVQALVLRLGAIGRTLADDSTARRQLDALLRDADDVIIEGRNAVMGLRLSSVHGGDIALAFSRLVERMAAEHRIAIVLTVRGAQRRLDPLAWEEVYHIGAEALLNACRHAAASRIVVELGYGAQEFALAVRDNGKGMDAQLRQDGCCEGHWGVVGMRERAAALNGTLSLQEGLVRGLEVQLRVPAARAYDRDSRPSWRRRLRAWLRRP